jgi:hypothetical protein
MARCTKFSQQSQVTNIVRDWSTALRFAKKATEIAETNPNAWGLLGKITVHKDIFAGWEGLGIPTRIRSREKAAEAEDYFTKALTFARRQKNPDIVVDLLPNPEVASNKRVWIS